VAQIVPHIEFLKFCLPAQSAGSGRENCRCPQWNWNDATFCCTISIASYELIQCKCYFCAERRAKNAIFICQNGAVNSIEMKTNVTVWTPVEKHLMPCDRLKILDRRFPCTGCSLIKSKWQEFSRIIAMNFYMKL